MQFGFQQCPYCGLTAGFVYIHGHYQCNQCKQNVMPCCGGEQEEEGPPVEVNTTETITNFTHEGL